MSTQDATSLALAIRRGETGAAAVMRAASDRVTARAELGAVRHLDTEMGIAAAQAFDDLLASGSRRAQATFGGVPFLMKDLGSAATGLSPIGSSRALAKRVPIQATDAALARRFRRAGLIPFGLTTTPEFGLSLTSEPRDFPPARNPFDPSRTTGGSSGGAACAVAAGIVAIAHATDAAGSIRVPAACCGLVGLKPTRGATPNGPEFSNHLMGLVGELVVARSVRDVAAALERCAGFAEGPTADPDLDAFDLDGTGLRLALFDGGAPIGAAQRHAVEAAGRLLEKDGHRIVQLDGARLAALFAEANRLAWTILSVSTAEWLDAFGIAASEATPLVAAIVERGRALDATTLFAAARAMAVVSHGLWRLFEGVDVILTPMLASAPPPLGAFPTDSPDPEAHVARIEAFAPFAALANVAGFPAISVPHGRDANELPLAVQMIAPMGGDRMLLDLAGRLERAAPWHYPSDIAGHP